MARYVAQIILMEYVEKHGIDYDETFAQIVPIGLLLSGIKKLISEKWHKNCVDLFFASWNRKVDDNLFFKWNHKTYMPLKHLYGLKQSSVILYKI